MSSSLYSCVRSFLKNFVPLVSKRADICVGKPLYHFKVLQNLRIHASSLPNLVELTQLTPKGCNRASFLGIAVLRHSKKEVLHSCISLRGSKRGFWSAQYLFDVLVKVNIGKFGCLVSLLSPKILKTVNVVLTRRCMLTK